MFMYSYCYVYGLLLLRMFCSVYSVFIVLFYLLYCVKMCTVLLPPGVNPTAVNKFIISYHIKSYIIFLHFRHEMLGQFLSLAFTFVPVHIY